MLDGRVWTKFLFGNSVEHEAELDLLVRKSFRKDTGRVSFGDGLYWTNTAGRRLLDEKAGTQMRNVGLDFVWFGNIADIAAFAVSPVTLAAWSFTLTTPWTGADLRCIAEVIRKSVLARHSDWVILVALVSPFLDL